MQFDTQRIKQDFNDASGQYHQQALLQKRVSNSLFELLQAQAKLPNNAEIIDAGCGTGFFAEASLQKDWNILQCDISESMLRQAAIFDYQCLAADINHLPVVTSCFDAVFSSLCLQWTNDLSQNFSEFHRILKPNGIIAISTLIDGTLFELKDSFNYASPEQPRISDFLSSEIYIETAQKSGFEIVASKQLIDVEYFNNLKGLMQSLKNIGATNKAQNRSKGLSGKKLFKQAESYYKANYEHNKNIPASYNILLLILQRK